MNYILFSSILDENSDKIFNSWIDFISLSEIHFLPKEIVYIIWGLYLQKMKFDFIEKYVMAYKEELERETRKETKSFSF